MMAKKVLKWVALAVCALGCVRIVLLYGMRGFLLYGALASAFAIYLELARQEEADKFVKSLQAIIEEAEAEDED